MILFIFHKKKICVEFELKGEENLNNMMHPVLKIKMSEIEK